MAEKFAYRRMAAAPRRISEIEPEKDIRVQILGRVIDKTDGTLVIDDGSAKAEIIVDENNADISDVVRVFARVLPLEEGFELRAEIVQDMSQLDMDLYKKVYGK